MSEQDLTPKAREALRHIRNFLVHAGKVPSVRELMKSMGYKSPHSSSLLINELEAKGFLKKKASGAVRMIKDLDAKESTRTVEVPLVGAVACGTPLLAEENIEAFYPVSVALAKPGAKHFLLRAKGDSMDRAGINDGDLLLIRQQSMAENGQKVVALIDDTATVKEFQWSTGVVVLKPHSSNPTHRSMILTDEVQVLGVVVTALPGID